MEAWAKRPVGSQALAAGCTIRADLPAGSANVGGSVEAGAMAEGTWWRPARAVGLAAWPVCGPDRTAPLHGYGLAQPLVEVRLADRSRLACGLRGSARWLGSSGRGWPAVVMWWLPS